MGLIQYRRRILNNAPRIETASGAVASFNTDIAAPLKECKISFLPVQDGSGDPSPENICPISGWTGCDVKHDGANIWGEEWEVGGINASTGNNDTTTDRIRATGFISVKPNTTYYCSIPSGAMFAFFYDADKAFISPRIEISRNTFTTPDNARFMRFHTYSYGNTYNHDISINYPSTDHDYHPYVGRTIPISWQTEAGTVYGGKLDVLSGKLVVDMAMVDMGDLTWQRYTSETNIPVFYARIEDMYISSLNTALCSMFKTVSWETLTNRTDKTVCSHPSFNIIYVADSDYDNASDFTTAVNGEQYCYKLATSLTIQLTPHEVNSLLGQNNIYADANGEVTVKYWTH